MGLFNISESQIEETFYESQMKYGTKFWEVFIRSCNWSTCTLSPYDFKVIDSELVYTSGAEHAICTFKHPYPLDKCLPGVSRINFHNSSIKIQFRRETRPLNGEVFVESIRCRQLSIVNRSISNIDLSADSICLHDVCSLSNVCLDSPYILMCPDDWFESVEDVKLSQECEITIMAESMDGLIQKFPHSENILNAINNAYHSRICMHLPLDCIKHMIYLLPPPSKLLNMQLDKVKTIDMRFNNSIHFQYIKNETGGWNVSIIE